MKRQKIRKALILIAFLLFPVIIYYLSPYIIIQGASQGIVTGSLIVFLSMFAASLFFGRAYCGWICSPGGLQECCRMVQDKRPKGGKRNLIKYFIWVPWITIIAVIFITKGGFKLFDFFYMTSHGISATDIYSYSIFYGVVILCVGMSFISGRRSFCHYICWMAPFMVIGTKIKDALKYPSLHLESDNSKCTGCSACTKRCPMSLEVMEMVKKENMSNSECILCGECVDGCPKKAIRYSFGKQRSC